MQTLQRTQVLPISINEAWDFFSNPKNLKVITPEFMRFDITSVSKDSRMYPGMIITYIVSPIMNIPFNWVTEITHVNEPHYFVDNQKSGPFKFWHHQHFFKEVPSGVEMTDIVNYAAPFDPISRPIEKTIVRQRVEMIFDFRYKKLNEMFGH
jgi:ligand-binding SRPBCC domain-containing protein